MADTTTRASRPPASGGKKVLGLDPWMWAVGGAAIILGYLYIKSKSSQQQGTGSGAPRQGGSPTGLTADSFKIWIRDHHGQPGPKPGPLPKPPKGDGHGK